MGKLATAWDAAGGLVAANGTVVLLGGANSTNEVPGAAHLFAVCSSWEAACRAVGAHPAVVAAVQCASVQLGGR